MEGQYIIIFGDRSVHNRRFRSSANEFKMVFKEEAFDNVQTAPIHEKRDALSACYLKCFNELLNYVENVLGTSPNDFVGIKFQLPSSPEIPAIGLRFLELQEISSEMITDLLMSVQQSNSSFESNDEMNCVVTVVQNPAGGARTFLSRLNLRDYPLVCRGKKRSLLIPKNEEQYTDNLCLPRAFVIAKHWAECAGDRTKFNEIFKRNNKKLNREVNALVKKAFGSRKKFDESRRNGCTMSDFVIFGKIFKNYSVSIYNDIEMHRKAIFRTHHGKKEINIFFFSQINHFTAISSVKSLFGYNYMCDLCKTISSRTEHRCSEVRNQLAYLNH